MRKRTAHRRQAGFSLLEMLVSVAVMTVIMAAVFMQIREGQQSSAAEQTKLDLFQEARGFIDQLARDLRATGYPSTRNFDAEISPGDTRAAVGLVKVQPDQLWFEGSLDGGATVSVIHYNLVQDGPDCPCLMRSQTQKVTGDPVTAQGENETEVQNVMNAGTAADPVFIAYDMNGNVVGPLKADDSGGAIANINTVAVILKVRSPRRDANTGDRPTTTLFSTVHLNNCSNAYNVTGDALFGCTGSE